MPQCNLETGVNEPVAFITVETTEEAADFIAPVVADNETIAEAVPVAAAEEAAEEAAVEAAEDKAQNKAEDRTEKAAEDKIEDKAEDKAKDKSAIDLALDDEPAIATVSDDDPEETQTTTSEEAIEPRGPEAAPTLVNEGRAVNDEAIEPRGPEAAPTLVNDGRADAFSAGKSASRAMAAAIARAVSAAAHAGFVTAHAGFVTCSEAASWAVQAAARSEGVQWLAAAATECAWVLLRAFVSAGLVCGTYVLRWVAQLLQHGLPWIAQTAPVAARGLISIVILRPELPGAAIAMLGSLSCFHRAYLWHRRWREARRAQRAAQVDAAARWVVGELKVHSERWTPISGGCTPIAPSDLRARVPSAVLADGSLWGRVAARVRSDMSVRVVPGSHDGISSEEGWLYVTGVAAVHALASSSAELRSPTYAFSPRLGGTPKTSAFAPTSAFSPRVPSLVATLRPIAPAA